MRTLVSLWRDLRTRLEAAGVDTPVQDARLLLEAGAGVSRLDILTDPRLVLSVEQETAVEALARRREAREPISQILGRKGFWSLEIEVTGDVLTPRPETEWVVEAALRYIETGVSARVLDLGVGSGAILLAILSERPRASGVGVDISELALAVARRNARALGLMNQVELRQGDWGEGVGRGFDIVVSNPPYVRSGALRLLPPEVARYEPSLALDGGADGLACYRRIVPDLPRLLKAGGRFALEVGQGQAEAVYAYADLAGLIVEDVFNDLAGIPRVVIGRRPLN